jgi:hypothetical protein
MIRKTKALILKVIFWIFEILLIAESYYLFNVGNNPFEFILNLLQSILLVCFWTWVNWHCINLLITGIYTTKE